MKAILPPALARRYSIRVGSDACTLRGFEIEPIHALFTSPETDLGTSCPEPADGIDEVVEEMMIVAPPVRKRRRSIASRAVLLGCGAAD